MSRKAKAKRPPARRLTVPVSVVDNLHHAQRIAKSIRVALAVMGGDTGFGPMAMAALNVLDVDIAEAIKTLGAEPSRY